MQGEVHAVDAATHGGRSTSGMRGQSGPTGIGLDGHSPPGRIQQGKRALNRALEREQQALVDGSLDHERLATDHGRQEQCHGERIERVGAFAQVGMVAKPVESKPARNTVEGDLGRHGARVGRKVALEIANDDGHAGGAAATVGSN